MTFGLYFQCFLVELEYLLGFIIISIDMMNKVLNGFVNRVFWIRVEGSIDQKL